MKVAAIIAAGGRGSRFGSDRPKQLLDIGGRSLLERSVTAFARHAAVHELVVVLPSDLVADPPAHLKGTAKPLHIVAGGARRQDSVRNGFAAVSQEAELIVIHDAARPFVSTALISRTIEAGGRFGAAVAAMPASDTIKQAAEPTITGEPRVVTRTLLREQIYLAQTPQAFRRDILIEALALGARDVDATDEAMLAERAGHQVRLVEGEASNIKITTPEDVRIAAAILGSGSRPAASAEATASLAEAPFARRREGLRDESGTSARAARVGTGYDLHLLVAGRPLVIGGVTIHSDRGALGHSDADVICHAITDAILGAASLGDIGRHFPDSDERWRGASSLDLLRRTVDLVATHGFE
ncbi:MAG: 2-C-methyl-D-erythritol 4-phosphate cytidylyltransferase, partial [Acidobacteria bacterium]|nr:2-C-methyl-D-erythritol 4-phosphate cytidylyltransferase [Acidobacteriota bacterium]